MHNASGYNITSAMNMNSPTSDSGFNVNVRLFNQINTNKTLGIDKQRVLYNNTTNHSYADIQGKVLSCANSVGSPISVSVIGR